MVFRPTVMQLEDETQEIAARLVARKPVGLGIAWMDQAVPFHASPSVLLPMEVRAPPTAKHLEADVHRTARRNPPAVGLGVA